MAPLDSRNERAAALRLDAHGAQVRAALTAAGVASILLKGRSLQALLYDPGELRTTSDIDLLVASADRVSAEETLRRLGYHADPYEVDQVDLVPEPLHAHHWRHPQRRICVDLHVRLRGTWAPEEHVWTSLRAHTTPMVVGGLEGFVLDQTASALLCALHRAQHPRRAHPQPSVDLERAVQRLERTTWIAAQRLADDLQATEAFASGLRLCPAAASLADSLGVAAAVPLGRRLMAESAPTGSLMLQWLWQQPRWLSRAHVISRAVFPSPEVMHAHHPLARRGRSGLALAYALRPVVVLAKAPHAVSCWSAAKRAATNRTLR